MHAAACQLLHGLAANRIESILAVLCRAPAARMRAMAHMAFGSLPPLDLAEPPCPSLPREELFGLVPRFVGLAHPQAIRLHPALLPPDHVLSAIPEHLEAILVRGDAVGDLLLAAPGSQSQEEDPIVLEPSGWDPVHRFYLRVSLAPIPGAMGLVASMLDGRGIPLQQVVSKSELLILSGPVPESLMLPAVHQIARSPVVRKPPLALRVLP